jgi:hypothetical protein
MNLTNQNPKTSILLRIVLLVAMLSTFGFVKGMARSMPDALLIMLFIAVPSIVIMMLGVAMWRRHHRIAARIDSAFIGTLAAGVRAKRRLVKRGTKIAERVERRVTGSTR